MTFQELQPKVTAITLNTIFFKMKNFSRLSILQDNIDYYNWVGFYFKSGN
jgi:GAF domain-containing protein